MKMNRTLVSSMAAFALMIGATIALSGNAEAGIFGKRHCGGGLFSRLCGAKSHCCTPEPTCCTPEPTCCTPEPTCCTPEPTCCGESVAAPVVDGCSSCGGEAVTVSSVDGDSMMQSPVESGVSSEGYDLAPGETLVPGSVTSSEAAPAEPAAEAAPAEPAAEEAPAEPAAEAVESSSDAPPVPDAESEMEEDGVGSAAKENAPENTDI